MNPNYLIVVFDQEKPNAKELGRKYISKEDYAVLKNDYFCSLDINEQKVTIVNRRWFHITHFDAHTEVMVIEIKKD